VKPRSWISRTADAAAAATTGRPSRARSPEPLRLEQSGLLGTLLKSIDPEQPFTVLNFGPALPETVAYFADFRSRLYFVDLFEHLKAIADPDHPVALEERLAGWLDLPRNTTLRLCLFWDLLDFLSPEAVSALVRVLRHYLDDNSIGHAFTVRNQRSPQSGERYGIYGGDQVRLHRREARLPGYRPHTPRQLQHMLNCYQLERTVMLSSGRLELALRARF
jgi:hypothetical protein